MNNDGHVRIIIPCTNEGEWLRITVDSILAHTDYPSFEIVIPANGDNITDFAFTETPAYRQVKLLRTAKALGVANGRNVATRPGDAKFYVFFDSHCLLSQRDWLQQAVDSLERHPHASMIQPEVAEFEYEDEILPGCKVTISDVRLLHIEYGSKWAWPYVDPWRLVAPIRLNQGPTTFEGMAGAGTAIFTRAETFHHLGRFDSEINGWFHATMDYCVRAWMLGFPMLVDPSLRVYNRARQDPPGYARTLFHMIHGALRTAYKYLSPRRRDHTELLFRKHGLGVEVDAALGLVLKGEWLSQRVRHLRERIHDDDWLFSKFEVYEERFSGQPDPIVGGGSPAAGIK